MTGVDPGYAQRRPDEGSEGIYPGRGQGKTAGRAVSQLLFPIHSAIIFYILQKKGGLYGDEIRR